MRRNRFVLSIVLTAAIIMGMCPQTGVFGAETGKTGEIFADSTPFYKSGSLSVEFTPQPTWHPDPEAALRSYEELPSKYFPVEEITPIKDQGDRGTCWSYAVSSAMEQSVVKRLNKKLEGDDLFYPDAFFSFVHHYRTDPLGLNRGDGITFLQETEGYNKFFISYLAMNGFGPVDIKTRNTVSSDEDLDFKHRAYRLKEARFIPNIEIYEIKKAIMKYGAVVYSICSDPIFHHSFTVEDGKLKVSKPDYYVFQPSELNHGTDHEVILVGWDDNIPAECFDYDDDHHCPENGGFIIKNSWGTDGIASIRGDQADEVRKLFGLTTNSEPVEYECTDGGYNYLSYADATVWSGEDSAIAYDMREAATDENLYFYDGGGGLETWECVRAANRFTAKANKGGGEEIRGAIFTVTTPGEYCVDVCLYSGEDASDVEARPWDQECVAEKHHVICENSGCYTVEFDEPVTVNEGESFAMILHREDEGAFNVNIEMTKGYGWSGFTNYAEPGESYMIDPEGNDWSQYDILGITPRIKAITVNTDEADRSYKITEAKGTTVIAGDVCHVSMDSIDPAKITAKGKAGTYDASTGLLTTEKKGTVKLLYPRDGSKTKPFCSVKVVSPKLKPALKIKAGKNKKIKLSGIKKPDVLWTSSDPSVVTVDEKSGELTGVLPGEAVVTATLPGYPSKHRYSCVVTVQ